MVIHIPDSSIPVFKVKKESGRHEIKTLHRNMLLPFSYIPRTSEFHDSSLSNEDSSVQKQRRNGGGSSHTPSSSESSEEESDSDSYLPRYVIPQRRKRTDNASGTSHTTRKPISITDSSNHSSGDTTHLSVSHRNIDSSSYNRPEISTYTRRSESINPTVSNTPNHSATTLSPNVDEQPRRSGRIRKPPDKYGEWISHQQSLVNDDSTQIWYV